MLINYNVWFCTITLPNRKDVKEDTITSSEPYISTLSRPELENLGLKAVAAGAKPEDLQQAYVTAQVSGNWQKLESVISNALGPEAIKYQGVGNPITGVTNLFNNFLGILCFED